MKPRYSLSEFLTAFPDDDASVTPVCTATVSVAEACINGVVDQKSCTTFPYACTELLACMVQQ